MNHRHHAHRAVRAVAATAVVLAAVACGSGSDAPPSGSTTPTVDPARAPAIASWTTVGGVVVPLGSIDGPTSDPGRPFTGYSHTPQGAALAAIAQSVQLSTAADDRWTTVLAAVTVPGPGRDTYAANRALVTVSGTDPATAPEILGYTITDYTDTAADVSVVQRFPDSSLAASNTTVRYTGSDWKLSLDTGGAVTALGAEPADMVALDGVGR